MKSSLFTSVMLVLTLFFVQSVEAGFSNSGTMQSKSINLSVGGTLDNNGQLIGIESANLSCDTLSGKGLIRAPQITIKTQIFAYTGTIDCVGKCTIITGAPFNERMFKKTGGGEFVIIVDENALKTRSVILQDYQITDELLMQMD